MSTIVPRRGLARGWRLIEGSSASEQPEQTRGQDKSRKVRAVGWQRKINKRKGLLNLGHPDDTLRATLSLCSDACLGTFRRTR